MRAAWIGKSWKAHIVVEGDRAVCKRSVVGAEFAAAGDDVGDWNERHWCKDCMAITEQTERADMAARAPVPSPVPAVIAMPPSEENAT